MKMVVQIQVVEVVPVAAEQVVHVLDLVLENWAQFQDEVAERWAPPHQCPFLVLDYQQLLLVNKVGLKEVLTLISVMFKDLTTLGAAQRWAKSSIGGCQ